MAESPISLHLADYGVIAAYFLAMAVIGLRQSSDSSDSKGFLLGGGNLPVFALAVSCLMAAMSAFSLVMVPGEIFDHGLSLWVLNLLTPLCTVAACAVFMRFYFRIGAFTPFEYLERRYDGRVRTLIAALTIYLRLIYLGMVLFSTSKIFEGAAGWPAAWTIILCGGVALVFTALGGLKAVVWTDVMQFVLLVGGLFCILGVLFWKIDGGAVGAVAYALEHERGPREFSNPGFYTLNPYVRLSFWILLLNMLTAPITAMASDQMTVQRLLASGSYRNAVRTQWLNALLSIPTVLILWVIGLSVFTFFHQRPELTVKSGDTALFTFIATQLPPPLPGLVLAGMLAAVISTLNAVFNSMAVLYLKEIHIRYLRPDCPEPEQVRVSRRATAAVGLIAVVSGLAITLSAEWLRQSVVEAQTIFYAFDAIVIPAFIFAVLSRKASPTLVWVTAGLLWGLKLAMITWYSASTASANAWTPGGDPGWGGPFNPWLAAAATLAGGLLFAGWARLRQSLKYPMISLVAACSAAGYGLGLALWAALSRYYYRGEPLALSFQWVGFPAIVCYALIGALWFIFGRPQPATAWRGLTLFDSGEAESRGK